MSLRFRRSFRVAPGLRLNTSLRGLSLSMGGRGYGVTVGSRGTTYHAGLPGTGLSYVGSSTRGQSSEGRGVSSAAPASMEVAIAVQDDGSVTFKDAAGGPLPPHLVKRVREQFSDGIAQLLESSCERFNADLAALSAIHVSAPAPTIPHGYNAMPFIEAAPSSPEPLKLGLLERLFRGRRERARDAYQRAQSEHEGRLAEWTQRADAHAKLEAWRQSLIEHGRHESLDGIAEYLEFVFASLAWPRETLVAVGVEGPLTTPTVWLDVDLPEIKDMPRETATVAARGLKLNIKNRSDVQNRRDYRQHVHGVLFRLIAETFSAIPSAARVVASGYTQRSDRGTGKVADEYVLSAAVGRADWSLIDFGNVAADFAGGRWM